MEFFDCLAGKGQGAELLARIEVAASGRNVLDIFNQVAASPSFAHAYKRCRVNDIRVEGFKQPDFKAVGLTERASEMTFAQAFTDLYRPKLAARAEGFTILFEALERASADTPPLLLETGALRLAANWAGDGQSTFLFDHFVRERAGRVLTIDINNESVETARRVCSGYTSVICNDSVMGLQTLAALLSRRATLLYLDSFDLDLSDPMPSAIHHIMELAAAAPLLRSGSLVAVDDFNVGGVSGGKGAIIDRYMGSIDARVIYAGYQKIWQIR